MPGVPRPVRSRRRAAGASAGRGAGHGGGRRKRPGPRLGAAAALRGERRPSACPVPTGARVRLRLLGGGRCRLPRRGGRCPAAARPLPARRRGVLRVPRRAALQRPAQPQQAGPEQPGDLHLGDADPLGDLLLGQLLVEAQTQDLPVAAGQGGQHGPQCDEVDGELQPRVLRADAVTKGHRVRPGERGCVEGERAPVLLGDQRGLDLRLRQPGARGQRRHGGDGAGRLLLQFGARRAHPAARLLHRARQPHQRAVVAGVAAELAAYGRHRVAEEGVPAPAVVAVHGLDQPQVGHLHQIGLVAVAAEARAQAAGQRHQRGDDALAQPGARRPGDGGAQFGHQRVDLRAGHVPARGAGLRRGGGCGYHERACTPDVRIHPFPCAKEPARRAARGSHGSRRRIKCGVRGNQRARHVQRRSPADAAEEAFAYVLRL